MEKKPGRSSILVTCLYRELHHVHLCNKLLWHMVVAYRQLLQCLCLLEACPFYKAENIPATLPVLRAWKAATCNSFAMS